MTDKLTRKFTRKHYVSIASVILASYLDSGFDEGVRGKAIEDIVKRFVTLFCADYPAFDQIKFRSLCGLP